MANQKQRVIVGVSGATGLVYATRALEILRRSDPFLIFRANSA